MRDVQININEKDHLPTDNSDRQIFSQKTPLKAIFYQQNEVLAKKKCFSIFLLRFQYLRQLRRSYRSLRKNQKNLGKENDNKTTIAVP